VGGASEEGVRGGRERELRGNGRLREPQGVGRTSARGGGRAREASLCACCNQGNNLLAKKNELDLRVSVSVCAS
jgi:hypothetical protein